jgi:hypothetical protein
MVLLLALLLVNRIVIMTMWRRQWLGRWLGVGSQVKSKSKALGLSGGGRALHEVDRQKKLLIGADCDDIVLVVGVLDRERRRVNVKVLCDGCHQLFELCVTWYVWYRKREHAVGSAM